VPPLTPTPTPTATEPAEELSYWYLHPQEAAAAAIKELFGSVTSNDALIANGFNLRHQYNLVTAPVGSFNSETDDYYVWQRDYIWRVRDSGSSMSYFQANRAHIGEQVKVAVFDPTSDIGQVIRTIEAGQDPLFDDLHIVGPDVYWHYLLRPYFHDFLLAGNSMKQASESRFQQLKVDYQSGGWTVDFGSYLAQHGGSLLDLIP
jgi:hypothetical protein